MIKRFSILLVILTLFVVSNVIAENSNVDVNTGNDYLDGMIAGKALAKEKKSGDPIWALAGMGCCLFGVIAASATNPEPPTSVILQLKDKSQLYTAGFFEGYRKEARKNNVIGAFLGIIVGIAIYLVFTQPQL